MSRVTRRSLSETCFANSFEFGSGFYFNLISEPCSLCLGVVNRYRVSTEIRFVVACRPCAKTHKTRFYYHYYYFRSFRVVGNFSNRYPPDNQLPLPSPRRKKCRDYCSATRCIFRFERCRSTRPCLVGNSTCPPRNGRPPSDNVFST